MNSSEAASHRGKFLAMAVVAGGVVANIYFSQPMLPLIVADLHASAGAIGLIPACTLAGFAAGLAILVPLGDRIDRKKIVLAQIGFAALFTLASALAPNFPVLLAASLGLGFVSCVPQQMVPFAAAISPPESRGRSVGMVVSGIMIGLLMGRTVGGALSSLTGWRAVFGLASVFMIAVFIVTAYLLPRGKPTTDLSYGRLMASLWALWRDHPPLRSAMASQTLLWIAFNAFWVNLAALLVNSYGLGPFWAGAFGVVGLVGAFAATVGGRASDRVGSLKVLTFSAACVTLSYVVMFAAPVSLIAIVAGVILLDLGCQSALVANQTRIFALDPKAHGRINTLFMTSIFLGGAGGAALSGWLMARYGWHGVASLGLAAGLGAMAVQARAKA